MTRTHRPSPPTHLAGLVAAVVVGLVATTVVVTAAAPVAAQSRDVSFEAVFGDVSLDDVDDSNPLKVDSTDVIDLELTVVNDGDEVVEIGQIRIESKLLSFTFLTQALRTEIVVEPGSSETVELPVDFVGVEGQASGYFRAEMRLLDTDGDTVADRSFALDIRGDAFAAANTVFYLLIIFAAVVVLRNVIAILKRRLEVNRLLRAFRLAVVGLQVGVVLVIASSLFRIRAMDAAQWIPLVVIATLIGFGIGYFLTLAPKDTEDGDELDPEIDKATVALAAERDQATRSLDAEADRPTVDERRETSTIAPSDPEVRRPTIDENRATANETIGPDDPEVRRPTHDGAGTETIGPNDPEVRRPTHDGAGTETIGPEGVGESEPDDD